MCGIAVAIDWDGGEAAVRSLIAGMLHRGDVTDPLVTVGNNIAMCTRRLRIVDAPHGVQPQASFDGRFLVSLNGEIYNHVDLRHELEALGLHFRTECDTEVVANALHAWGSGAIKRLAGMYAFVAVDTATGEFLAARDPFRGEAALSDAITDRLSCFAPKFGRCSPRPKATTCSCCRRATC